MIRTPWGYDVDAEALPPILSVEQFHTLTDNRLCSSDEAVDARLRAASSAVRDYCGWHVSPVLGCVARLDGGSRVMWLPCMGVRAVSGVTVCGCDEDCFEFSPHGELRLGYVPRDRLQSVEVRFEAGYDAAVTASLAQAVAQLAENALVAAPGVREEHAGGVGLSYNATDGVSGGVRMHESDLVLLEKYRIHDS